MEQATNNKRGLLDMFKTEGFAHYLQGLKFGTYTMFRPLDGFWDLTHEKRGNLWAAHTFVLLRVIIEIMRLTLSSFQFIAIHMQYFNAGMVVAQVVAPVVLWTVANWSLTTLMDGKGRMMDVYMGYAYALVPWIIIDAGLIPLSHLITAQEGAIFWTLSSFAVAWFVMLLISAMMQIHDYSIGKTILSSALTLLAIGIVIFIIIMFVAVVSDMFAYFISVFREVYFRVV